MGILKKIKNKMHQGIEYLAAEQKKTYGNQKLDCCDLNKKEDMKK